jgi:Cof subfamily protein (haloacid dehalogenase superfamily)
MTADSVAPPPLARAVLPERVEMVVLDLDGTCLDFHQQLHPRIEAAVRQAGERVPVAIASGRMYRSVLPWARRLGIRAPLICYQGALVQAMPDPDPGEGVVYGRLVSTEVLDAATAQLAIATAREHGWHRQAYIDDNLVCEEDRPEGRAYAKVAAVAVRFVDDLSVAIAGGTVKVVCVVLDAEEAGRCRELMTATLGPRARVTPSYPQFIEIASPRAGKGPAVRRLAAALGVELSRAVAIGDAPNDVDMLETVGFGVAVEGALEEVLRSAACTCAPPAEGGVADVLGALGLATS